MKRTRYLLIGIALLLAAIALTGRIYPQSLTHSDAEALRIGDQKGVIQPSPQPLKDPLFVGAVAFNITASVLDMVSTQQALHHGATELNPVIGSRGERLVPVKIGLLAMQTGVGYYAYTKGHRKAAIVSTLISGAIFAAVAAHNFRQ